ncbi:MAG: pentapeptide repeat-containing protein, partial [Bdellovibrionales bacterium]|nr:pentapeptide repeat-containing protein [Bdellovibrionales bacterium]
AMGESIGRFRQMNQVPLRDMGTEEDTSAKTKKTEADGDLEEPVQLEVEQTPEIYSEPSRSTERPLDAPPANDPRLEQYCLELLKSERILDFNLVRPAGALNFQGVNLARLNLTGADLRNINFTGATLTGCNLQDTYCQYANFNRASLDKTNLSGALFFEASLKQADLTNVLAAKDTQFVKANFTNAFLSNGNFAGAVFTGARLLTAHMIKTCLDYSHLNNAELMGSVLTNASFVNANLHGAQLFQSNGRDINFKGANLTKSQAIGCHFTSSNTEETEQHPGRTNFEGAWTKDFIHQGAIPDEMLRGEIREYPPESFFEPAPATDKGIELVDGIPGSNRLALEGAKEKMYELIGQAKAKEFVEDLITVLKNGIYRQMKHGLTRFEADINVAIVGPPGVGKSTFAEILIDIYFGLGLLKDPEPILVNKSGFVAGFQGQTSGKVESLFDRAAEGRGIIAEEIYTLNADSDSYSADAVSVIADRTERDRGKHALFLIGYEKEMMEFLGANSGLARRFEVLVLDQQTPGELIDISKLMLNKVDVGNYSPEFLAYTSVFLEASRLLKGERYFGNAGDVRTITRKVCAQLSKRVETDGTKEDKDAQQTPEISDLPFLNDKLLGIPRDALPALEQFTWRGADGRAYRAHELPTSGSFPEMSEESIELLREVVERYRPDTIWSLEKINTLGEEASTKLDRSIVVPDKVLTIDDLPMILKLLMEAQAGQRADSSVPPLN